MRVTILTMGSRGDVQPYLALAIGLKAAGYSVQVASHAIFESWIRGHGIDFSLVRFNPKDVVGNPEIQRVKANIVRFMLTLRQHLAAQYSDIFDDFWEACRGSEGIIASPTAFNAYECAQALSIPLAIALLQPLIPTRDFPSPFLPPLPRLCGSLNKVSHHLFNQLLWQNVRTDVNDWRKARLGLRSAAFFGPYRRMHDEKVPHLVACSPRLIPKPADWRDWHHLTGYWFLPQRTDFQPPHEIENFLGSGSPPVYVGFGSMNDEQPQRLTDVVIEALERLNQRAILATGWGGLQERGMPDSILQLDDISHQWLFPQMAAIVHHGGAGTTAAALSSGVPSIIVPFGGDQQQWGHILVQRGLSPQVLPVEKLTAGSLANAISVAINDRNLQRRAKSFGESIQREDGVTRALELVDQYFRS